MAYNRAVRKAKTVSQWARDESSVSIPGVMLLNKNKRVHQGRRLLAVAGIVGLSLWGLSSLERRWSDSRRVVSIQEFSDAGESCDLAAHEASRRAAPQDQSLFAAFQETTVHAQDAQTVDVTRPPVRDLVDTAPIFSSVGVDPVRDEVYLQDSNQWSIRVFSRLDNAKPGDPPTEPRRIISGGNSDIQFNSCVWVDPGSGDIYTVENDTGDSIVVFPNKATGDPKPARKLTARV